MSNDSYLDRLNAYSGVLVFNSLMSMVSTTNL